MCVTHVCMHMGGQRSSVFFYCYCFLLIYFFKFIYFETRSIRLGLTVILCDMWTQVLLLLQLVFLPPWPSWLPCSPDLSLQSSCFSLPVLGLQVCTIPSGHPFLSILDLPEMLCIVHVQPISVWPRHSLVPSSRVPLVTSELEGQGDDAGL